MRRWLIAWWFAYSFSMGQQVQLQWVGPFDNDGACNNIRNDTITRLTNLRVIYGEAFSFQVEGACQPDRLDRRPR